MRTMTSKLRRDMLQVMPPASWNLIAQLFDAGAVQNTSARDAVAVDDFLRSLIKHPEFTTALKKQQAEREAAVAPPPTAKAPKKQTPGKKKGRGRTK